MRQQVHPAKDIVRKRSGQFCERCRKPLVKNGGVNPPDNAQSIHHRQPRRNGGRDTVGCMVNICVECHRRIHDDELSARLGGWIVWDRNPATAPFESWRGWVLPGGDGSLALLDFDAGRLVPLTPAVVQPARVADRPQYDRRAKTRLVGRTS